MIHCYRSKRIIEIIGAKDNKINLQIRQKLTNVTGYIENFQF